jgi:hypothetical protein
MSCLVSNEHTALIPSGTSIICNLCDNTSKHHSSTVILPLIASEATSLIHLALAVAVNPSQNPLSGFLDHPILEYLTFRCFRRPLYIAITTERKDETEKRGRLTTRIDTTFSLAGYSVSHRFEGDREREERSGALHGTWQHRL